MPVAVPTNKPQLPPKEVFALAKRLKEKHGVTEPVVVVAVRGYYDKSLDGKPGNARGIYDDAAWIVTPDGVYPFNINTDPSIARRGIATLKTGVHYYRRGNHGISKPGGGYPAFRPDTPGARLPVTRDGQKGDAWGVAINIHKGSRNSTSSEGCQTIHPSQWDGFRNKAYGEMDKYDQPRLPYILIEERDRA